ncbi:MAG: ribosome biogenesis GTPase Der [Alphaproteobacteria bacterium]
MEFTVALIGRPNVGKSTLFNRLTGKKHAIVYDTPGVTRDRREGHGKIGPLSFKLIDTAGLEEVKEDSLQKRMMRQTELAIGTADVILLLTDARSGINEDDKYFAKWARKHSKPVILVINKAENRDFIRDSINESYKLGLGEPVCISAAHGEGLVDLYDAIEPFFAKYEAEYSKVSDSSDEKHIQISIIGRPNAGKSTLLNQLLKTERVLTGPEAGITRDSIAIDWNYKDQNIRLIDTAGVRRRSQVNKQLEKLAIEDTLRAIKYSHVTVLLLDATIGLESQDLNIANIAIDEGRALVIAVNKWDQIENKDEFVSEIKYRLNKQLGQVKGLAIIYLSALYGDNIYKVIDAALDSYDHWNKRVNTAKLNLWLKDILEFHPLPLASSGKRIKIKYITQIKTRPPTFMLFTSHPSDIPDSYIRYLANNLREEFDLQYTPIRFSFKKGDNPYKDKK